MLVVPSDAAFVHGVASGDPLPTRIVLWTRVTLERPRPVRVRWEIATDPQMQRVVQGGATETSAARDFTVKVDVDGLKPDTHYWYQFTHATVESPIGHTRTAPQGHVEQLRFAVASCSSYARGYFHGYRHIAEQKDLNAVIHLGDYIYESASTGELRQHEPPREAVTLDDYRQRYAQYRRDPDLQAAHAAYPFIVVWDDHELVNDAWSGGAKNHDPEGSEGTWEERRAVAVQAYHEWMPIRERGPAELIYRSFKFGDLVDLIMLDTRLIGRDRQVSTEEEAQGPRQLMGEAQMRWLDGALAGSKARWAVLGQQVMVAPLPEAWWGDRWDGYPQAREGLLTLLKRHARGRAVILTGDIHSSWANDIPGPNYDPETQQGSLAVELVAPALSARPIGNRFREAHTHAAAVAKHVRFYDLDRNGYFLVQFQPDSLQATWFFVNDVKQPQPGAQVGAVLVSEHGSSALRRIQ